MKKITDLMMKLNEIDFKSQDAFKKYKAKHAMRSTTKVNIAGKDTTAGGQTKIQDLVNQNSMQKKNLHTEQNKKV